MRATDRDSTVSCSGRTNRELTSGTRLQRKRGRAFEVCRKKRDTKHASGASSSVKEKQCEKPTKTRQKNNNMAHQGTKSNIISIITTSNDNNYCTNNQKTTMSDNSEQTLHRTFWPCSGSLDNVRMKNPCENEHPKSSFTRG